MALPLTRDGLGYGAYLGEVTGSGTLVHQAALPGAEGSANHFLGEVGLYTSATPIIGTTRIYA